MNRLFAIALSGIVLLTTGAYFDSAVMMYLGAGALGLIAFRGAVRN